MFINFSTNGIILQKEKKIFLKQNNLEEIFPGLLKENYSNENEIYILNGPGSFTNIRIGTLSLNTLNFLLNYKITFFDISKINFYQYLYENNFLPSIGIIFIGQRKKAWFYNFEEKNYKYILYDKLNDIKNDFFIDEINNDINLLNPNLQDKIININFNLNEKNIIINFKQKSFTLSIKTFKQISKKTKILKPNYMIKPNICL